MATNRFRGDAPAVAQVSTLTPGGTIEATDLFIMTINGKSLSVAAGGTTVAAATAAIVTAWNASTIPEFAEITASDSTTHVTLTADTAGVPFTVTVSTTEANGDPADAQTFATATTTTSGGPSHWDDAKNWTLGAVPANTDDVVIENSDVDLLYGLDQNGVTLTSLTINKSFTGDLGLPRINASGSTSYAEYREQYLKINATTITIGRGDGSGSGRLKINTQAAQTTITVQDTASAAESDLTAVIWKGTHASNAVTVNGGSFGASMFGGETATIATLRRSGSATVVCTSGVSLTTVTTDGDGGSMTINSAATTVTQKAGTLNVYGSGAYTTLNVEGGTCNYQSTGAVTTLNATNDALVDYSGDSRSRTVTNANVYGNATINDPNKTVTWSNGINLQQRGIGGTINLGTHLKITPAAVS